MGTLQDGTYEFIGSAIRSFIGALGSRSQLHQLTGILNEAQHQHTAPAALADRIETQAPELSAFAGWVRQYLIPKNSGEVTGLISMILAAIAIAMSMAPKEEYDEKTVSVIVEKAVETALIKAAQAQPQARQVAKSNAVSTRHTTVKRVSKKIGRNDPCPCSSGKKYKLCCIGKRSHAAR